MRTIIDLPERQVKALKKIGNSARLSRAELVRRAVAEFLDRHQLAQSDEAFGLWKARGAEGLTYQDQLRAEWGK